MTERRKADRRQDSRDRLLTDDQVAELAGVSANTVRYWRQTGELPFVKLGRHPRVWLSTFQGVFGKPGFVPRENANVPVKSPSLRTLGGGYGKA
jgi:excisionase family DNA binding protein